MAVVGFNSGLLSPTLTKARSNSNWGKTSILVGLKELWEYNPPIPFNPIVFCPILGNKASYHSLAYLPRVTFIGPVALLAKSPSPKSTI